MNDCIERKKAIELIQPHVKPTTVYGEGYMQAIDHAVDILELMPAADVQPVKHGRWEYSEKEYGECAWYFCSECDEPAEQLYNDDPLLSEFCPHCGARMMKDGDTKCQ